MTDHDPLDREMACKELVELVTDYLERALDDTTRTRFESHLLECPGCVEFIEQIKLTSKAVSQLAEVEPPPPAVRDQLLTAFRELRGGSGG